MKLLTINTHSLSEENQDKKLLILADAIEELKPDVIAMQEVNQTINGAVLEMDSLKNVFILGDVPPKKDNYAIALLNELERRKIKYNLCWTGFKKSYEQLDEGIAIMSRSKIDEYEAQTVSITDDYDNWRKRKIVGIKTQEQWFYSLHLGWWHDDEEPFLKHWEKILNAVQNKENVWLMGDFNSEADVCGEGYNEVLNSGWYDTYELAQKKDNGYTASGKIDGWQDSKTKRIDYIFTNNKKCIKSSNLIFDGKKYGIISDHFGIIIEVE